MKWCETSAHNVPNGNVLADWQAKGSVAFNFKAIKIYRSKNWFTLGQGLLLDKLELFVFCWSRQNLFWLTAEKPTNKCNGDCTCEDTTQQFSVCNYKVHFSPVLEGNHNFYHKQKKWVDHLASSKTLKNFFCATQQKCRSRNNAKKWYVERMAIKLTLCHAARTH